MADREGQHVLASGAWSAWLDGELSEVEQARVAAHLAACSACRSAVEEWRTARWQWRACAPTSTPAQAEAFWAQLAPGLAPAPRPRPDPALYLAPAALALGWVVWQGLSLAWAVAGPLGGWHALAMGGQRLVTAGLLPAGISSAWLPPALALPANGLAALAPWLAPGSLWVLAEVAINWAVAAALAMLYVAWIVLWLRQPKPEPRPL